MPLPPGGLTFSEAERWPEFSPQDSSELSHLVGIAALQGGWIEHVWTRDFGAARQRQTIISDTTIFPNNSQYIMENFLQMNRMYSSDGVYHAVFGAVQEVKMFTLPH